MSELPSLDENQDEEWEDKEQEYQSWLDWFSRPYGVYAGGEENDLDTHRE